MDDEVIDLIAEAARVSRHAVRAYELIREQRAGRAESALPPLAARQALIFGRMADVPITGGAGARA